MTSSWNRTEYPREGDGVGFDRVVFFSDAVFAIALTLAAVEIGLPEVEGDPTSVAGLWDAVLAKNPLLGAFLVAFVWVAIYWRANHRFVMTLRAMDSAYVLATLFFLALIALLPIPAGVLGEYWDNPLAIILFAVYASAVSGMELVLFLVAKRNRLFIAQPGPAFARVQILGSLSPIVIFLTSIPLAFWSSAVALLWWPVGSFLAGFALSRIAVEAPEDPAPG
ncbi:MAG: TMEM175 family protein [Candidatus Nanopelagicales bacterium]